MYENKILKIIEGVKTIPEHGRKVAVVHPCDVTSLQGIMEAYKQGVAIPFLYGPEVKIREVAKENDIDVSDATIIDCRDYNEAAVLACRDCREGKIATIMKGSLHTDELMKHVVSRDAGLRAGRRISHAYVLDMPSYNKLLMVSDCALNISPDFDTRVDIVKNAIEFARSLGIKTPKVALLSSVEHIYSKIPNTIEAAAIAKMTERNQITNAIVDGPLAFDNAISALAASIKGVKSAVAGDPDILVPSNLEAANILAKQAIYLGNAKALGVVLGAKVPVVLTSRADSIETRVASIAAALSLSNSK